MKTFEDAVRRAVQPRPRRAREAPAPSQQLDAGVHAIGKKVVEEAAEVWMAAEHEGKERDGRGDLPAALPRAGADDRPRAHPRRRLRPPVSRPMQRRHDTCRIAVPNKGSLSEAAAEMLREAGYRQRRDSTRARARRPGQRRRVLLPAPARHRDLRRRGHARRRHHRPRPAARLRRQAEEVHARSASAARPSASPAPPGATDLAQDLDGLRIATSYVGVVERLPAPTTASTPPSSASTAPSRPASSSASPT